MVQWQLFPNLLRQLSYAFLLLLFVIACKLTWHNFSAEPHYLAANNHDKPDVVLLDLQLLQFDHKGAIAKNLASRKAFYFTAKNKVFFMSPTLAIYRNNHLSWIITAYQGQSENWFDTIELKANVVAANQDDSMLQITTEKLLVYPEKRIAETELPIVAHNPFGDIHAVGMLFNFDSNQINLLHSTQATYEKHTA